MVLIPLGSNGSAFLLELFKVLFFNNTGLFIATSNANASCARSLMISGFIREYGTILGGSNSPNLIRIVSILIKALSISDSLIKPRSSASMALL